jgi:putative colanic acid biosynthesis acetyltransferase WcaF
MTNILVGIDPRSQASFSLQNRLMRVLWGIACAVLCRWTPRPLHAWRALVLRLFGARLGRGCHIYPGVRIWAPWNLVMEDQASLGEDVICYNIATITVGRRAVISQGAHLCTGTHDYEDPSFQLVAKPITIGAEAWICAEAFIAPGVTIGDGAVIGARSLVTGDMPAWMVCAGMPAAPLKLRRMRDGAGTP